MQSIDLDYLDRDARVNLLPGLKLRDERVAVTELGGERDGLQLLVVATADAFRGSGEVSVLVETSPDGSSWTEAEDWTFSAAGEEVSVVDAAAFVRVTADPGSLKSAQVAVFGVVRASAGGGSQPFVRLALRHSADFANVVGGAPVTSFSPAIETALTLPPSLFGNDSIIDVLVYNPTASDVVLTCTLVVQSADGTVWIQQDTPSDQTIAAGGNASIDFSFNAGSAGVGLSWNSGTKQVDIANAGVYSAFVTAEAQPA